MFCRKCGTILEKEAKFCAKCGTSVAQEKGQTNSRLSLSGIKALLSGEKKKYVLASVVTLGIVLIAVLAFAIFIAPNMEVNAFTSQIEARNYREADLTYEELDSEDRTKANQWMQAYIASLEEKYYTGTLDYATVTEILDELTQFKAVSDKVQQAGENILLDNRSSISFDKAKEYAESKKWREAYTQLQSIHIKYRLYNEVVTLREECVTNYRLSIVEQMNTHAADSEIDKMIAARDSALLILPDDKEIIQAAQTHLDTFVAKMLADAKTLADSKDFAGAMDLLQYAVSMYEHEDFWSALEGYGYDSAEAHCEALVAQNDLLGAVKYAKGLADADTKYDALLKKYAETLVQNTLNTAKGYADNREFEKAIRAISDVQVVYDCDSFKDAVKEYTSYLPQKLSEIQTIENNNDYWIKLGTVTDIFNVERDEVCSGGSYGGTVIFYTSGRYVKLSGQLVATKSRGGNADSDISIKIYADDKLLYESGDIAYTEENITINLDITGVRQLKLVIDAGTIFDATVS